MITIIMMMFLVISPIWIYARRRQLKQREEWEKNPVPAQIDEFDRFFWQQVIGQQYWYLKHIYNEEELNGLIGQYGDKIKTIEEDATLKKIERSIKVKMYSERLKSLIGYRDYIYIR